MVVCVGSWVQWWVGARRGLIAKGEGFGGASYPSGGRGSQQQQQQQQQLEITLGYLLKAAQLPQHCSPSNSPGEYSKGKLLQSNILP